VVHTNGKKRCTSALSFTVTSFLFSLTPTPLPFYKVHPLKRASSSCVYSQCAVHIVVGPCTKGHFIHAMSLDPEFFLFFFFFFFLGHCNYERPQQY
jgi:hypothetical protein